MFSKYLVLPIIKLKTHFESFNTAISNFCAGVYMISLPRKRDKDLVLSLKAAPNVTWELPFEIILPLPEIGNLGRCTCGQHL